MIGEIVQATRAHAFSMAPNLRAAEVREVMDSIGLTPTEALLQELGRSLVAWAWIVDGEVACMFGIVTPEMLGEASYPWFLTTPLVERYSRQFARACKALLPELLTRHPKLVGKVDARYTISVRWLRWLGARVSEPQPWGVEQQPFHHFEIGA